MLKRICAVLLFLPVCVVSPLIALGQYIWLGYVPQISPWGWLFRWADGPDGDQEKA
jgi:hypothetical protein